MYLEKYIHNGGFTGVTGLFFASGSFGTIDSEAEYAVKTTPEQTTYEYRNESVCLQAVFTQKKRGVVSRRDYFTNVSNKPLTLYACNGRFVLSGNSYEAYTQYNGWQHESSGNWQELVTQVSVAANGIRTCDGATPMMALRNKHNGKIDVFHLFPNAQWRITAKKRMMFGKQEAVVVETGFETAGLHLEVAAGERIELPEIWFYTADNRVDLDAYKLHEAFVSEYPRKKPLPILYNTWLADFDCVTADGILRQVDTAAELGVEMFMIDAGWFGENEGWWTCVGDWTESPTGKLRGRVKEIAERVRSKGMKFGLWLEPERAALESKIQREHPEYFTQGVFLNFADENARKYIFEKTCEVIDTYGLEFLKFDFNVTVCYDATGCAFYRYMQGSKAYVEALRARYPDLYITNCASGGARMDLGQARLFDSFWFTDNQGPYEGLTIIKNTLKRMPTALIERWNVQTFRDDFPATEKPTPRVRLPISCNNATWDFVLNVDPTYTFAFMTGGPLGFSCDIASFPEDYKAEWKAYIEQYKRDRAFYAQATARVLVDANDISVFEYADSGLEKCVLQFFTKLVYTDKLTVYPAVADGEYLCDGKVRTADEIRENGVVFDDLKDNSCIVKVLQKVK
ncbi:MAG: alpha-galactosidase [Clostridia bacterium]|nr:alpha-galactosidase [Clostridia bacterium]